MYYSTATVEFVRKYLDNPQLQRFYSDLRKPNKFLWYRQVFIASQTNL